MSYQISKTKLSKIVYNWKKMITVHPSQQLSNVIDKFVLAIKKKSSLVNLPWLFCQIDMPRDPLSKYGRPFVNRHQISWNLHLQCIETHVSWTWYRVLITPKIALQYCFKLKPNPAHPAYSCVFQPKFQDGFEGNPERGPLSIRMKSIQSRWYLI